MSLPDIYLWIYSQVLVDRAPYGTPCRGTAHQFIFVYFLISDIFRLENLWEYWPTGFLTRLGRLMYIYGNTDKQVFWHVRVHWCIYMGILTNRFSDTFGSTDIYITHQSTRMCQKTCLSVFPYIFQAKYIRNKKINENKLVGGTTTWGTIWGPVYKHLWIYCDKIWM